MPPIEAEGGEVLKYLGDGLLAIFRDRFAAPAFRNAGTEGYEAERAARQYRSCEPENRLVARTLERAWEEALAEQARLRGTPAYAMMRRIATGSR